MPRQLKNYNLDPSKGTAQRKTKPQPEAALPLPVGVSDWFQDPNNAAQLRELLNKPVLRTALAILLERARPTQGGALTSAAQGTSAAALGYYAGYADAIKDLRTALIDPMKLAEAGSRAPSEASFEEPWDYVVRKADLEVNLF